MNCVVMKTVFISDIHGAEEPLLSVINFIESNKVDRIVLSGDLMYHGPRNPLPNSYAPSKVADILNRYRDRIVAVRGNCDSEVDQMLLEFPCMGDCSQFRVGDISVFVTHGHLDLQEQIDLLPKGTVVVSGHTHLPVLSSESELIYLNPGSTSLPKSEDGIATFGYLEENKLQILSVNDYKIIKSKLL